MLMVTHIQAPRKCLTLSSHAFKKTTKLAVVTPGTCQWFRATTRIPNLWCKSRGIMSIGRLFSILEMVKITKKEKRGDLKNPKREKKLHWKIFWDDRFKCFLIPWSNFDDAFNQSGTTPTKHQLCAPPLFLIITLPCSLKLLTMSWIL